MPAALPNLDEMSFEELDALIAAATTRREEKRAAALEALRAEFQEKAARLGIPVRDILASIPAAAAGRKSPGAGKKLPAKFRGPHGEEWTGKGKTPRWLVALEATGRTRSEFAVS